MTPRRLAVRVDVGPLVDVIGRIDERAWLACPADGLGDAAVPLVAVGGTANFDYPLAGHVRATAALERWPALVDALAAVGVTVARARLVRLASAATATLWSHHWRRHAPICVAIRDGLEVTCDDEAATLAAGEAWLLAGTRVALRNMSAETGLYFVIETRDPEPAPGRLRLAPYRFEVLDEHEFAGLCAEIRGDLAARVVDGERRAALEAALAGLERRWNAAFARFGHDSRGELTYDDLVAEFRAQVLVRLPPASAGARAALIVDTTLTMSPPAPRRLHRPAPPREPGPPADVVFDRPVFVVSAPRAGSTVLFDLLAQLPGVWTIGDESHALIRGIPGLHPEARGYASDRLTEADATPDVAAALRGEFAARLIDRDGRVLRDLDAPGPVRMVEKTPANALRIPFLRAVFPGALFVHLRREPRENISSLVEGWRSRRFLAYRAIPGWPHRDWSFLLPPGWKSLVGRSLVEIAAYQWWTTHEIIVRDLRGLPGDAVLDVAYDELIAAPGEVLPAIAARAGLGWDERCAQAVLRALPLSRVTVSAPVDGKWRRHEDELAAALAWLGA